MVSTASEEAVTAIGSIGGTIIQLNEVSSNIAEVTQAAEQTGSSSQEVLTAANEVSEEAKALKQQVDTFLTEIKAI